jgi:hypothetical protein
MAERSPPSIRAPQKSASSFNVIDMVISAVLLNGAKQSARG